MDCPGRSHRSVKVGRRSRNAAAAWTRPLWPVHVKPFPDELLSSWFMRLAQAHGLKVQTLFGLLFGAQRQIWNRDIDRQAPDWVIDGLSWYTATPKARVADTTLHAYVGRLFRELRSTYVLQWILPLQVTHVQRALGLQFCPQCLAEDREPHFRKRWRVALCTWCAKHGVMLRDRCPACGAPVIFHRRELGRFGIVDGGPMNQCYACDFDLRESQAKPATFYDASSRLAFELAILRLEERGPAMKPRSVRYYNVLHQLCRLIGMHYRNVHLKEFAEQQLGADMPLSHAWRMELERRSLEERHHILQLAFWYLADLEPRLSTAWNNGAVTYSALLRDFKDRPRWFDAALGEYVDWRKRQPDSV